jgi:signal transduction histidine kinase
LEISKEPTTPKSIKRRAKLLRAEVTVTNRPEGGTCIQLNLKFRKWRLWP